MLGTARFSGGGYEMIEHDARDYRSASEEMNGDLDARFD
jgi:hypothetical protein